MRVIPIILLLFFGTPLRAEESCPKYRDGCVPLEHFQCSYIRDTKDIQRLCYNEHARYMIIWLGTKKGSTPYHYCDIGPHVIIAFKSASPVPATFD